MSTTSNIELTGVTLGDPLRWKKPRRVFVNSMSDLFHRDVPFDFIDRVFSVMALTPQHTYQILTKRPERMAEYLEPCQGTMGSYERRMRIAQHAFGLSKSGPAVAASLCRIRESECELGWPLPNVHLGTSCEHQKAADGRITWLLKCPAAVRFLSIEPLLGPVHIGFDREILTDLMDENPERHYFQRGTYPLPSCPPEHRTRRRHLLHWVIVGGESGPGARPCNVAWIRDIVQQCKAAGVPCFVKQLGARPVCGCRGTDDLDHAHIARLLGASATKCLRCEFVMPRDKKCGDPSEWPEDLRVREFPVVGGAK